MKKLSVILILIIIIAACNNNDTNNTANADQFDSTSIAKNNPNPAYDPHRGEGKFKKVDLAPTLDQAMATNGEKVYSVKCSGCHKMTDEKLVGPGWKGVTGRNTPEWIMNFITNTDEMLTKDPKAQAQLEICLVRMPNQNLSDDDARHLLEFMRKNDGVR
ncbi:MAG TPA: c-type cytochrome [Ferruginibacter sp.]|nr:c-type cytochrome [Ferruginibacter sp.]